MVWGEHPNDSEIPNSITDIFYIFNTLFPDTYLFCDHYRGSSVTCERDYEEYLFDPENNTLTKHAWGEDYNEPWHIQDYCDGWYQLWDEETDEYLELSSEDWKKQRIKRINDILNHTADDYEDFEDFIEENCEDCSKNEKREIMNDELTDEDLFEDPPTYVWDGDAVEKLPSTTLTKDFILEVLKKSTEKGYTELTAMLLEKCKDILHSDFEQTSDEYTLNIDEDE